MPTDRFERKREAILQASTRILNDQGIRGLTLAGAGAAVGLSTASIGYYFRRRDDLAAACLLGGIARLMETATAAMAQPSPDLRLHSLVAGHMSRLGEDAPFPALGEIRALAMPQRAEVFEAYVRLFRRLRTLFDHPDLEGLSRGRRTARTHILLAQILSLSEAPPSADPGVIVDLMLKGVAPQGSVWSPANLSLAELSGPETGQKTFLRAATRMINARGYHGASVDRIAADLNLTKGSFYHHLQTKDELVAACLAHSLEVMARLRAQAEGDDWAQLSAVSAALAEFQLSADGPLLRSSAFRALPDALRAQALAGTRQMRDWLAARVSGPERDLAARLLMAGLNAGSDLAAWVPGVSVKAAPAILARPLLMGLVAP